MALIKVGTRPVGCKIEGVHEVRLITIRRRVQGVSISVGNREVQRPMTVVSRKLQRVVYGTRSVLDARDRSQTLKWTQKIKRKRDGRTCGRRGSIACCDQCQNRERIVFV